MVHFTLGGVLRGFHVFFKKQMDKVYAEIFSQITFYRLDMISFI